MQRNQARTVAAALVAAAGVWAARSVAKARRARDAMARTDPDMRRVLDTLAKLGAKPVEKLSVAEARRQPTPADAVRAILIEDDRPTRPPADVSTRAISINGATGPIAARVHAPPGDGPHPVIIFWHGGGWVIADLDTYEESARALAREADAIVVSCHYRQAPEHKFPAAHEDAFAAYQWVLANAADLGGDPTRIAVAGESAGGNLAANVAIRAREEGVEAPVHQLLIYPVAGSDLNTPSYVENAQAKPLSKAGMQWFIRHVFARQSDAKDARIDLAGRDDLHRLPPATIIVAAIDPLRSDGERYAERLESAGVPVRLARFDGVTHEFFGMDAVVAKAREAQAFAGRELRHAFAVGAPAAATG